MAKSKPTLGRRKRWRPKRDNRGMALQTYLRYRRPVAWSASTAIVLLLIVGSWADHHGYLLGHHADRPDRYEGRAFHVVTVIDGDTLDVARAESRGGKPIRVRLWGIDTPETAKPFADEPAQPLADEAMHLTQKLCEGETVRLSLQPHRLRGRYGRLLAYVQLPDGTWLNERLLAAGLARADDRFPHDQIDRYRLLQQQAKADGVGLWGQ